MIARDFSPVEELQLTLTPARVDQRNFGIMLANWRVGQQLSALVVATRPDSSVLLSVGGKNFVATTDLPVQPGSNMTLEVKQLTPEVILRQLPTAAVSPPAYGASHRAAENSLLLSASKPSLLFTLLSAQSARFGSPEFQEMVKSLLNRTLKETSLTPAELRKAVRNSGLFTESDLSLNRPQQAAQSVKNNLSSLQAIAMALSDDDLQTEAESRVMRQIADRAGEMLRGIAHNQLASLPSEDGAHKWVVTLPISVNERFQDVYMEIARDGSGNDKSEDDVWRANLQLDLPRLGVVDISIKIVRGAVSVDFLCEASKSSTVLKSGMGNLEESLIQRQLRVDRLSAEAKPDVVKESSLHPPSHGGLSVDA